MPCFLSTRGGTLQDKRRYVISFLAHIISRKHRMTVENYFLSCGGVSTRTLQAYDVRACKCAKVHSQRNLSELLNNFFGDYLSKRRRAIVRESTR